MKVKVPLKPFDKGHIASVYGGPATSPADVLRRARHALAPRGAWSPHGWHSTTKQGVGRCALQAIRDVDGPHEKKAASYLLQAIQEKYPEYKSVEQFNDNTKIQKHDVLGRFDRAIELSLR